MSFLSLIVHNVTVKKLRLALTSLAVAIGVLTVVSLGVVTESLKSSDLAILKIGQASFAVSQKGVSDLLASSINQPALSQVRKVPGVAGAIGVLVGTTKLNADNPQFLEIGIQPSDLAGFGVTVLDGHSLAASSNNQAMLGWRAAQDLGVGVGGTIKLDSDRFTVVGTYSTGQAMGDDGVMLPLNWFQAYQRQEGQYTLLFVQTGPGASVDQVQKQVDDQFADLTTIRTVQQFGRADRSLALIMAADRGATILAVIIGAVVVMSAMTMSFIERTKEFGVLGAVGWTRRRVGFMIICEGLITGLIGVAGGLALGVLAVAGIQHLPSLVGVLHPDYTTGIFGRALLTAFAMVLLGALVPAIRAAAASPLESLRHE
jgi:putative ABC transport system permease protein